MFLIMQKLLLLVFILRRSSCQRRITNGSRVPDTADSSFVVYIVGARVTDGIPGWMCGGCIIQPLLVLTSAACVSESRVKQMYVIAGYKKYVSTIKIDQDPCTKRMKKRIVSVCKHNRFKKPKKKNAHDTIALRWTRFDMGVAKVDTPFDFFDDNYLKYCSYRPSAIKINFDAKYFKDNEVVTYGWGHSKYYRPDGDLHDYNEPFLMYASSKVFNEETCRKIYNQNEFHYIYDGIEEDLFCTHGKGALDASGKQLDPPKPVEIGCGNHSRKIRKDTGTDGTTLSQNRSVTVTNNPQDADYIGATRRNGICQNDHGTPAVTWIGGKPYVRGVATAFRVNHQMECMGPYLYASITCSTKYIHCVLNEVINNSTRRFGSSCIETGAVPEEADRDWLDDYEVFSSDDDKK